MTYRNLKDCVLDLEAHKELVRIDAEVDPYLEVGAIQRRVTAKGGPALLFTRVKGCHFPMLGNLFGTRKRVDFIFRDTIKSVEKLIALKVNPQDFFKHPFKYIDVPLIASHLLPKKVKRGPVTECETTLSALPQLVSWPKDGGAFITLPQVYTELASKPGFRFSNLGMYRIQISGNEYLKDQEVGLHYQIHRGIGVHQTEAMKLNQPFRVNIFVGGAPAMTMAAVMPLPEGLPELFFGGALSGRRIRMIKRGDELPIYAEADFCISGTVIPKKLKPEGPFGDHLGYYSLQHPFPVLKVDHVYHRHDAIWPFTTVGRPPQEDSFFGEFIHDLTGPIIPTVIPGVKAVQAVDATGVHPLLLAIGSERYTPYDVVTRPQELLTQANAILGQGQLSLAKYLFILNDKDVPELNIHNTKDFLVELLRRIHFSRDLHFQTQTTMDTLDYSSGDLNSGSKVVMAAIGKPKRQLDSSLPLNLRLPEKFGFPKVVMPGVLAVQGPAFEFNADLEKFCQFYTREDLKGFPLIVIVDDSEFVASTINNFLWVTFTRSNPEADIHGIESFVFNKHWGCNGSLVIDARIKPHHAPPLVDDPQVEKKIDEMSLPGRPLYGII